MSGSCWLKLNAYWYSSGVLISIGLKADSYGPIIILSACTEARTDLPDFLSSRLLLSQQHQIRVVLQQLQQPLVQ